MPDNVTQRDAMLLRDLITSLTEMLGRVDERVKILLDRQSKQDENVYELRDLLNTIVSRVTILESKTDNGLLLTTRQNQAKIHELELQVQSLNFREAGHDSKWNRIIDISGKIIWVIITAYILFRLGLPAPALS